VNIPILEYLKALASAFQTKDNLTSVTERTAISTSIAERVLIGANSLAF
jgi:hypothetical protein